MNKRPLSNAEKYNIISNSYSPYQNLPYNSYEHCVVKSAYKGHKFFAVGGVTRIKKAGDIFIKKTFYLDTVSNNFSVLSSDMKKGRAKGFCHVFDKEDKLLVGGGYTDSWKKIHTITMLDLITSKWSDLPSQPMDIRHLRSRTYFTFLGKLFVFDGNKTLVYDLQKKTFVKDRDIIVVC